MKKYQLISFGLMAIGAIQLSGCGGESSASNANESNDLVTLQGTAATGAALDGVVQAINADGKLSEAVEVNTDGSFTLKVPEGSPYMLKGISDNLTDKNGKPLELFSYTDKDGKINITPLTTQALFSATNQANLSKLYESWASSNDDVSIEKIEKAAKQVVANLRQSFSEAGVSENTNIFNVDFQTNGKGFDAVLDKFNASYDCNNASCVASYTVDGKKYDWNYNLDTKTVTFDTNQFDAADANGNSTLTVNGSSTTGGVTVKIPTVVLENIPKPKNNQEFCSSETVTDLGLTIAECSFDGNEGKLAGSVKQNGFTSTFAYTYTYS